MRHLLHALPVVCLLASAAPPRQSDELANLRDAYAAGLQALSDDCSEANLLNDADRLLIEAAVWASEKEALTERQASLQQQRIALVRSTDREEYRSFLKSKRFDRRVEKLQRDELDLKQETAERLIELAHRRLKEGQEERGVQALESAFVLDPESDKLRRVAGRERFELLRESWNRDHSLSRLSLGETLQGPQVTLADFEGKVVLWRSASL